MEELQFLFVADDWTRIYFHTFMVPDIYFKYDGRMVIGELYNCER